jgi:esterase/lipase superfamily enzyme
MGRIAALAIVSMMLWPSAPWAIENHTASHLDQHRRQLEKFQRLQKADPGGALAFARSAVDAARLLRSNDPKRGDALELLALAHFGFEEFDKVIGPATEVVRIRKAARPVDHELLALALGTQAAALFALDRTEQADAVLWEQLASWRKAFGPRDVRLAQKLEQHGQYVQKGFGRTRWAIEFLQEAAAIREANPHTSRGKFAATLQELAILQMHQSAYSEAEANLARAGKLLEQEIAREPAREENKAGLAQILVLRAGIAGALGEKEQAIAYAETAKSIRFKDRVLQAENQILVAAALSSVLEKIPDLPGAIAEQKKVLEVFRKNEDLLADGSLDRGGVGDTFSQLGALYLEHGELVAAREALASARQQLGETSELLFGMAELERKSGNEEAALRYYREALRLRKESASEVSVMFGTNRMLERGAERARFGGDTSDQLSLGQAVVLVPGGQFSRAVWLNPAVPVPIPVGMATNPERLVIRSKDVMSGADFRKDARAAVARARLYPKSALVFIHGYNVTFDDALRRAAQLTRDLNYDSAAFLFSWPSKGDFLRYGTDRASADEAAKSLADFFAVVEGATGAEKIHIIAHSMGNRVLLPALVKVVNDSASKVQSKIGEVILAAPAVPTEQFSKWIDELSRRKLHRFTLYASAVDKAMRVGYWREGLTVLAGYVNSGQPLLNANVQSIDVSEAGTIGLTNLNHDVFASNPVMTEDMRQLLQTGRRPPHKRIPTLEQRPAKAKAGIYWYYRLKNASKQ